jgi:hypothetical protein
VNEVSHETDVALFDGLEQQRVHRLQAGDVTLGEAGDGGGQHRDQHRDGNER